MRRLTIIISCLYSSLRFSQALTVEEIRADIDSAFTEVNNQQGIRKVRGAKTFDIMWLLNSFFLRWIGIALALGLPLSVLFLSHWMNSFAYRQGVGI